MNLNTAINNLSGAPAHDAIMILSVLVYVLIALFLIYGLAASKGLGAVIGKAYTHLVTDPAVRAKTYSLVRYAEDRIKGDGRGTERYALVAGKLKLFAPWLSDEKIDELIGAAFMDFKGFADSFVTAGELKPYSPPEQVIPLPKEPVAPAVSATVAQVQNSAGALTDGPPAGTLTAVLPVAEVVQPAPEPSGFVVGG